MRCKECGYLNNSSEENCIKCGTLLVASQKVETPSVNDSGDGPATVRIVNTDTTDSGVPTMRTPSTHRDEPDGKKTVIIRTEDLPSADVKEKKHTYFKCDECQYYPLKSPVSKENPCPNCGHGVVSEAVTATIKSGGTMKLSDIQLGEPNISVTISAEVGGKKVAVEGTELLLNRDSLDPSNSSLSSGTHARISLENGTAFLEDLSTNGATFVQVVGKMELRNGMKLILGNKLYQVNIEEK